VKDAKYPSVDYLVDILNEIRENNVQKHFFVLKIQNSGKSEIRENNALFTTFFLDL